MKKIVFLTFIIFLNFSFWFFDYIYKNINKNNFKKETIYIWNLIENYLNNKTKDNYKKIEKLYQIEEILEKVK